MPMFWTIVRTLIIVAVIGFVGHEYLSNATEWSEGVCWALPVLVGYFVSEFVNKVVDGMKR